MCPCKGYTAWRHCATTRMTTYEMLIYRSRLTCSSTRPSSPAALCVRWILEDWECIRTRGRRRRRHASSVSERFKFLKPKNQKQTERDVLDGHASCVSLSWRSLCRTTTHDSVRVCVPLAVVRRQEVPRRCVSERSTPSKPAFLSFFFFLGVIITVYLTFRFFPGRPERKGVRPRHHASSASFTRFTRSFG